MEWCEQSWSIEKGPSSRRIQRDGDNPTKIVEKEGRSVLGIGTTGEGILRGVGVCAPEAGGKQASRLVDLDTGVSCTGILDL